MKSKVQDWLSNIPLLRLLGLTPVLAISDTLVTGLWMGCLILITLVAGSLIINLIQNLIPRDLHMLHAALIFTALISFLGLVLHAYVPDLDKAIEFYLSALSMSALLLYLSSECVYGQTLKTSVLQSISWGTGYLGMIAMFSFIREILAHGTLFKDMPVIFMTIESVQLTEHPVLLFTHPAGAMLLLGCLFAFINIITKPSL